MPTEHGLRVYDHQARAPATPETLQDQPEKSIPAPELEEGRVALEDFDLLAQCQVLGDQGCSRGQAILQDEERIRHPGSSVRPFAKTVMSRKTVLDCAYEVFRRDTVTPREYLIRSAAIGDAARLLQLIVPHPAHYDRLLAGTSELQAELEDCGTEYLRRLRILVKDRQ